MVSQDIITAACARALITRKNSGDCFVISLTAFRKSDEPAHPSHTVELQQSVAARNTGKVTRLLLLRTVGARDQCAVFCAPKPSVWDLPVFEATSGVYSGSRIV